MFDRISRLERRFRRIGESLSPLELQTESPARLSGEESQAALEQSLFTRARDERFLGFYTQEGILRALDAYGVGAQLAQRGYEALEVELDVEESHRHRLRVLSPAGGGERHLLIDFCAHVGTGLEHFPPSPARPSRFLVIDWLNLQDPGRPFGPLERLPGQAHPGLGLALEIGGMIGQIARRLQLDGCLNSPAWYHNAIFYHHRYRYVSPAIEGRLLAISRGLRGHSVAEISWAIEHGCVIEGWRDGKHLVGAHTLRWEGRPQVWAMRPGLRDYFRSARWLGMRDAVRDGLGVEVDWVKAQALRRQADLAPAPGVPGGSPV